MDVSEWLQEIKTSQQPAYIDVQFIKKILIFHFWTKLNQTENGNSVAY